MTDNNSLQHYDSLVLAGSLIVIWVLFFWLVKNILLRRLRKWAAKTSQYWDDILVSSLSLPLNFLILASGLAFFSEFLSFPENVNKIISHIFLGSVVFAIVFFADNVARASIERYAAKSAFKEMSHGLAKNIVRGIIIGLGALILMDMLGISITPILASLGIGSLAVALALQETLSNFFAGVYIAIDKPVRVGDYIKVDNADEGYVIDVSWRSTRIRTLPNNVVIVPNKKLMESTITNFYLPEMEMVVTFEMGVHYNSDLEKVEKVVLDVAKEVMKSVQGSVSEFEPFIRFHTLADSSINFTVIMRVKEFTDQYTIKHEFIKHILPRFRKENIVIPYPTRTSITATL